METNSFEFLSGQAATRRVRGQSGNFVAGQGSSDLVTGHVLCSTPHAGQIEFLLSQAKLKVLACGRRWGKTFACADLITRILRGVMGQGSGDFVAGQELSGRDEADAASPGNPHPSLSPRERVPEKPQKILIVAPTLDQARILFDRVVCLVAKAWPGRAIVKSSPYPKLTLGPHEVVARSGHLPRALRGHEATHVIVDEAAFVADGLILDTLFPMLAATDGTMTLISTPNGFNAFQKMFDLGQRNELGVWSRAAPTSENPHVSAAFLAAQRELVSERTFAVEYEARFLESEGAVFRAEAIEGCMEGSGASRGLGGQVSSDFVAGQELPEGWPSSILLCEPSHPSLSRVGETVLRPTIDDPYLFVSVGIDWGRVNDWTAVVVVCGTTDHAFLVEIRRFRGMSYVDQLEAVREILVRYPRATVTSDTTGVGVAVADIWRRVMPERGFREFTFGAENRTTLIERLVSLFERRAIRFRPDPVLQAELRAFQWKHGKAQGVGEHDDVVMALGLACYVLPRGYCGVMTGGHRG